MYKINDVVWYVPRGYNIAIKCKIVEIDDYFYKKDPRAYIFYWLDEPVGHSVDIEELYDSAQAALDDNNKDGSPTTLEEYRRNLIHFIVGTHYELTEREKLFRKTTWYESLPPKTEGVDWIIL